MSTMTYRRGKLVRPLKCFGRAALNAGKCRGKAASYGAAPSGDDSRMAKRSDSRAFSGFTTRSIEL